MGVKNLNKIIESLRVVELKEFKGCTFAIDAMVELTRVFKGKVDLTNSKGEKTHHIKSLLSLILKFQSLGIKQIWVFDHDISNDADPTEHFKYKQETLQKRRETKEKYKAKYSDKKEAYNQIKEKMKNLSEEQKKDLINLLEVDEVADMEEELFDIEKKIAFPHRKEINDLKFMLDTLGIKWVESLITYEGEATCAKLAQSGVVDYVFTPDLDALMYGAPNVISRVGKGKDTKYLLYNLESILKKLSITYEDFVKIGLCLGTDANTNGIKGIGVKTVLNKFRTATDWNKDPYKSYVDMFMRKYDVSEHQIHNSNSISFSEDQQKQLIDWLVIKQDFDRERVTKQFNNKPQFKMGNIVKKTPLAEIDWSLFKAE
jgi:5'-3' exonuclease